MKPWNGTLGLIVQCGYLTSQIFLQQRGSLLKSPVMCANICASAHGSGLGGPLLLYCHALSTHFLSL